MRPVSVLALVSLLAVALAGCADDAERYPDGVPTASSSTTRSSTASGTGGSTSASASSTTTSSSGNTTGPVANTAPTAGLTATPLNGTAPVNVTFSLSGADADGDALGWILTFGDGNQTNGTTLPTTLVHEYKSKGNLTAVLSVSDGVAQERARVNLTIAGGPNVPAVPATQCDRDVAATGVVYVFEGDGGTWAFVEENGIAGLQVENNHPTEAAGVAEAAGEHNDLWEGCENGDQMVF